MRKGRLGWKGYRRGVGGPEVVILVAILGFLIALLLPAIQASREAARRMQCTNQIRQIMIAMHGYHDVQNSLPAGVGVAGQSVWVPFLPFIEHTALYDSIMNQNCNSVAEIGEIVAGYSIPAYQCASEPTVSPDGLFGSYHACSGDAVVVARDDWKPRSAFGATPDGKPYWVNFASITDGMSNTMAFSESRIAAGAPTRARYNTGVYTDWSATETEAIPDHCAANHEATDQDYSWLGARWYDGRMTCSRYLGILPPNSASCVQQTETNLPLISASSYHAGGVNVGMCDGSVQFVSDDVDAGDPTMNAVEIREDPSPYGAWGAKASMNGDKTHFSL